MIKVILKVDMWFILQISFLYLKSWQIPGFPVYTRAGEMLVSIESLTSGLQITREQQRQIKQFHSCILAEVLRLDKPNLDFDPFMAEANYLILPLNRGNSLVHSKIHMASCAGNYDRVPTWVPTLQWSSCRVASEWVQSYPNMMAVCMYGRITIQCGSK